MTNPETLKQLFRDAREEVKRWPEWMKREEREAAQETPEHQCSEDKLRGERLSA